MAPSSNATSRVPRTASDGEHGIGAPALVTLAWLVPGAAHIALGYARKGAVFATCILAMFALGIAFAGRISPLQISDPLVFLAALAQWGLGLPRLAAGLSGWGTGDVTVVTYEYGNTFLITAGLRKALVVLDAYDRARARAR